jgi:HEPN domain-containing protein
MSTRPEIAAEVRRWVEKYLKALLILRGVDFPRTHDLVVLFNLLRQIEVLNLQVHDVQPLNRYSIESRYPGDWEPIDASEANTAFAMAKNIRTIVRPLLESVMATKEGR